ncbi:hypothetical protein P154DRAFT_527175 [Amniculicola lignicola CBS 123094]|uniref:DUF7708 domain-containing protein n=1 Tax=Amniculicola lignicola CBS 123094 TaxID=1392246 RepID=A0A6A5VZC7_9PLEO|nr:hypothetical protein P154DRAFT_527175 [Amniculicola lignicola CBS 123094]
MSQPKDPPSTFWDTKDEKSNQKLKQEYLLVRGLSGKIRKQLSNTDKENLRCASREDLEVLMQHYMDDAVKRQDDLQTSERMAAKTERGLTRFLNSFHGYVEAYSGIVSLVKGAGGGYGEAAYGALAMFLVIAVNKHKTESFIENMLVELRQQYLRTQMLNDAGVYSSQRMKEYTAVLYRQGVEFLYEAVRYYSIGAWRRLRYVLTKPPSVGLESKVSDIKTAIVEIEREARALDGVRLNQVEIVQTQIRQEQLVDKKTLGEVRATLATLQERSDKDRLDIIRRLLRLDVKDVQDHIDEYELQLDDTFGSIKRLPAFDVDAALVSRPEFQDWREHDTPTVFLLHGATVAPDDTSFSWLSPACTRLIRDPDSILRSRNRKRMPLVMYHVNKISDWDSESVSKTPLALVLSKLIYQVVASDQGKTVLREEERFTFLKGQLEALVGGPPRQTAEKLQVFVRIWATLLKDLEIRDAVLVLDRIDNMQGSIERVLEITSDLVRRSPATIKVFATARTRYLLSEPDIEDKLGSGELVSMRMDQDGWGAVSSNHDRE